MRTSKRRRMCSAQKLGWLSSSYSSTLATKLDDVQGKSGRLEKDETVQSGRCCVTTEKVVQSSQSTLLDPEGCSGDCIGEESQSSKCLCWSRTRHKFSARRSSLKGMVVSETSSVTQEWVDEGELPRERTKNRRWRRPYDVRHGAADRGGIVRGNATQAIVSCEGHDHAEVRSGATGSSTLVYDTTRRRAMDSRSECHGTAETGIRRRVFLVCVTKLASDESPGHQHMGAVYHQGSSQIASTSESHGGDLIIQRPCMRVAVCLSIDQGELLGGHSGVEAGGRKGRGSDNESSGAQLPKSKASVRKEVDSEEHHSDVEADLPIAKEGIQM
ncbi:hypothetical protein BHM03_00056854 [Ensete ventricosum]|nr:hypothetical protein BHM03_00056854 [Ensete ventricosum]